MSVGPMGGIASSAAGAPLSQTSGSETERSQKDTSAQRRLVDSQDKSEKAAGIGTTEQDQGASDRDADGRRLWEAPVDAKNAQDNQPAGEGSTPRKSKDPTGNSGNSLDLLG